MTNTIKTFGLLAALSALLVLMGSWAGGRGGALMALVFAGVMNLGAYWFSDKVVLWQYRARLVEPGQLPRVEAIVERLCARANLPRPRIYVIPQDQPNAFATGRNPRHAAVAVTEGILSAMPDEELEGVLAHELSHVRHRDILIGAIAATLAGAITWLAYMVKWGAIFGGLGGDRDREGGGGALAALAMAIVAPIAAMLVQLAVSRSREYAADAAGAELAGNPYGLARALRRLGQLSGRIPMEASPATAHMFIVSPLSGGLFMNVFSTHPPLAERIRRLVGEAAL
jgi:heat shock protein HtpX